MLDGGAASDSLDGGGGDDQAVYSSRREALSVTLDGEPGDGARGENDRIKTDVEGVAAGAGADRLDTRDGTAGDVSCGSGRDDLTADRDDRVDADCEQVNGRAFGMCTASARGIRVTRTRVTVRVSCSFASRGSVRLTTARRARRVNLGSRSFSAMGSRTRSVAVRLTRTGRRALLRSGRLRVRVTVTARPRTKGARPASRKRSSRLVTLRVPNRSGARR
jgi:hypothetical protein